MVTNLTRRTVSEAAFEAFCQANDLAFEKIAEGTKPTPDYVLRLREAIYVEIKQIDEDTNFSAAHGTRLPGSHIRAKINQARDQIRSIAQSGSPTMLLIYNNLDPLQAFGTEQHDFFAGMYGDLTWYPAAADVPHAGIFHGRNKSFREGKNDSFSAVGWLHRGQAGFGIHLYENAHARVPLDFASLPACIQFNRVQVEDA